MAVKPIIFSPIMVRALLDGRKTQTRRALKRHALHKPKPHFIDFHEGKMVCRWQSGIRHDVSSPYAPGDLLWVREAWAPLDALTHNDPGTTALALRGFYRADGNTVDGEISRWRPSIHMPRWAARLTLRVTDVRVQRVQDISEADAVAEGIKPLKSGRGYYDPTVSDAAVRFGEWTSTARQGFQRLWNSIHGPDAWDANPWVCALTFDVIRANVDEVQG